MGKKGSRGKTDRQTEYDSKKYQMWFDLDEIRYSEVYEVADHESQVPPTSMKIQKFEMADENVHFCCIINLL